MNSYFLKFIQLLILIFTKQNMIKKKKKVTINSIKRNIKKKFFYINFILHIYIILIHIISHY